MYYPFSKKLLAILFSALLFGLAFSLSRPFQPTAQADDNVFGLVAPAFVSEAHARPAAVSAIENEAGIAAYFKSNYTINLNDVRDAYRTIELETADYIIGSVPVAGYPESEDVHMYIHKDGWFLAYYLKADPAAKIIDWVAYHNSGRNNFTNKLENTLTVMASEANVSLGSINYYDFRYPNATHMMLVAEWVNGGKDPFDFNLPSSHTYFERSWSAGTGTSYSVSLYLDGIKIIDRTDNLSVSGFFSPLQLLTDQFHTIEVQDSGYSHQYGYGGLALVYRVP
ncbi:MAG: hypothetical protein Kow0031_02640 [Anaerolineae bacterium]